ncbi:MAG: hypothetical protein ACLPKT_17430 [Methylocella sp.]
MRTAIERSLQLSAASTTALAAAARSCVRGDNTGLGGEQALDCTPDEQANQPPDIALA